ncbi:MAG: T9SS type A sorting domain-containing protein [Flavobacterium sp.]|nr:T9SS type A sorting domain-containing protein [Flavobacterium sp.]
MKTKLYYLLLTLLFLGYNQNSFSQDTELSNSLMNQMNEVTNQTNKSVGLNKPITRNCITSILLEAKKNWDKLTPQAISLFSPYIARPVITNEQIGCSTNFCFHYTLSGADAVPSVDTNSNGFPDYVDQMASVFENVWTQYQTRSYTMPPLDGTAGGSNKYDVYIINLGSGRYGSVTPDILIGNNPQSSSLTEVDAYTSFMKMNNNYSWATPITTDNAIKVTAAHEFFHAVQLGTSSSNTNFIMEATAAWSEDEIYPGIDDNFQYLRDIFSTPDIALNYNSSSFDGNGATYNGHWYGAWIFFRYLSEKTNPDIIRQIYNNTINLYEIPAINDVLTSNYSSNFNTILKNYLTSIDVLSSTATYAPYTYNRATAYKNYLTNCTGCYGGVYYEKAFNFSGSQLLHSSITTTSTTSTFGNGRLMRLGADYFDITTNQNFKVRCLPTLAGSPIQTILLKYNLTTGIVSKVEGQLIGGYIETSVGDFQNYNAYTLIVYRPDYVANNQNNLNSEQYVFDITQNILLNDSFNEDNIVLFPSPCNSEFFIQGKSFNNYQLINSLGQIVKNSKLDENLETQKISVLDLSEGIYYLKLSGLNGVSNKKIVVKR